MKSGRNENYNRRSWRIKDTKRRKGKAEKENKEEEREKIATKNMNMKNRIYEMKQKYE